MGADSLPPPRRPRGRPRVNYEGVRLSTWLPTSEADRVIQLASGRQQTVSAFIREVLILNLPATRPPAPMRVKPRGKG